MGALGEAGKTDSPDKAEAPYRGDMHNRITKIDRGVNRIEYWISFFILAGGPMTAIWKWAFGNMNWAQAVLAGVATACFLLMTISIALMAWRYFRPLTPSSRETPKEDADPEVLKLSRRAIEVGNKLLEAKLAEDYEGDDIALASNLSAEFTSLMKSLKKFGIHWDIAPTLKIRSRFWRFSTGTMLLFLGRFLEDGHVDDARKWSSHVAEMIHSGEFPQLQSHRDTAPKTQH